MSARDTLTPELRAEVLRLEDDLRARVDVAPRSPVRHGGRSTTPPEPRSAPRLPGRRGATSGSRWPRSPGC